MKLIKVTKKADAGVVDKFANGFEDAEASLYNAIGHAQFISRYLEDKAKKDSYYKQVKQVETAVQNLVKFVGTLQK